MNTSKPIQFGGLTPYVYYKDAGAVADWLVRCFGFVETSRHPAEDGSVQNVELTVGSTVLWLDGDLSRTASNDGPPVWIGVWVDDVDAMYAHTQAVGAASDPPEDKPYGVRMLTVKDPEGVSWGFIKRI
jgi:uncharacterized glyoxalase superfamily protein PhnB